MEHWPTGESCRAEVERERLTTNPLFPYRPAIVGRQKPRFLHEHGPIRLRLAITVVPHNTNPAPEVIAHTAKALFHISQRQLRNRKLASLTVERIVSNRK